MRAAYTDKILDQLAAAPVPIQRAFEKQVRFLLHDLRYPSLKAKKYDEARDIWQARVTGAWRLHFRIEGDSYVLLSIGPHPK
jgi:mRNA-degrading endonuclease RelE of RelBE toxin-antitoxin system